MNSKVLVTGANGFVGGALVCRLAADGRKVRAGVRHHGEGMPASVEIVRLGDLGGSGDWREVLAGIDIVVHAAARVHVMKDVSAAPLAEFRRVNVAGTLEFARQAADIGVKRFVFLSSAKVNGEVTQPGHPFTADDRPAPSDPYGISKMEAEQGLRELAAKTGMEVVIVRPPLVYGPGVKANFAAMMRWLARGVPLPLGAVDNRRSMVALENLVDLLILCMTHPAAANQTFMVSDGEDMSTSELLKRLARAMGKSAILIPVPVWVLRGGARFVGRADVAQRLCGMLQVDIGKTTNLLGWVPQITVDQALEKTAAQFCWNSQKTR